MMARTPQDGSPKIPAAYSVVDVAPSDSGYETDATAFSEGAFSDEDDRASLEGNETSGLLAHHGVFELPMGCRMFDCCLCALHMLD